MKKINNNLDADDIERDDNMSLCRSADFEFFRLRTNIIPGTYFGMFFIGARLLTATATMDDDRGIT